MQIMSEFKLIAIFIYILNSCVKCYYPIVSRIITLIWLLLILLIPQIKRTFNITYIYGYLVVDLGIILYEQLYPWTIVYDVCVQDFHNNYYLSDFIFFYLLFVLAILNNYMKQKYQLSETGDVDKFILTKQFELINPELEIILYECLLSSMIFKILDIICYYYLEERLIYGTYFGLIMYNIFYYAM